MEPRANAFWWPVMKGAAPAALLPSCRAGLIREQCMSSDPAALPRGPGLRLLMNPSLSEAQSITQAGAQTRLS